MLYLESLDGPYRSQPTAAQPIYRGNLPKRDCRTELATRKRPLVAYVPRADDLGTAPPLVPMP